MGEQRVAVITGGSRGIGREIALHLHRNGWSVAVCGRNEGDLRILGTQESRADRGILSITTDIADPQAVGEFARVVQSRFRRVDLLIANAAILGPVGSVMDSDSAAVSNTMAVNFNAVVETLRAFMDLLCQSSNARVIAMSGGGVGGSYPMQKAPAYAASKAAVATFVEVVAEELMARNIPIISLAPGNVPTGFLDQVLAAGESSAGSQLFREASGRDRSKISEAVTPLLSMIDYLTSADISFLSGRLISARWNSPESLEAVRQSISHDLYKLRRIDDDLFKGMAGK